MSDKMRWRYGDTNPVVAAVDAATVIEIGELLWQDVDDAKPASEIRIHASERRPDPTSTIPGATGGPSLAEAFAGKFLGVAMQRSRSGEANPLRVAATGVFEFNCPLETYELGELMAVADGHGQELFNQRVARVQDSQYAIARVAKREPHPSSAVLVDIRSTVMTGGVR